MILDQTPQLGVTLKGGVGTIRVYSANATEVTLCLLNPENPRDVVKRIPLTKGAANIWEGSSKQLGVGTKYAITADGPKGPTHGFNDSLLLIDPYAKGVVRESAREYHCEVIDQSFDWQGVQKPNVPLDEAIVYEAHARGLTRLNEAIPDEKRGTYAALGHESTIAHFKRIGITSVELLPIHMIISEPRLMNMGLINYWGYNSINFFTPHHRYASAAALHQGPQAVANELKTAIRELHRAGIEVLLDVVYNHTAEGGYRGLTYSYRGLDNASYYRIDEQGNYHDTTGCGNSLNFANPMVVQLVLDSLRYWTEEYQIDGFRFDLATTLARDENNTYNPNHPLLRAMQEDPALSSSKLIVEPWDVGLGGWQTGHFPDRFSEWNDRYRDSVRRFWLTDVANARTSGAHWNGVADLATKLAGSKDVVDGPAGVLGGINFITAHDGFTLHDLVSYNVKHNQVNGESNRDGTNNNYSFNHGAEGELADSAIQSQRRKAIRNLLGTLLFSAGVPMVTAGDERGKTQLGNNNAYCQDSTLSWVHWELGRSQRDLEQTLAHLTRLRRENPSLRPKHWPNYEEATPQSDRVRWFGSAGGLLTAEEWQNPENRTLLRLSENLSDSGGMNGTLLIVHGSETEQQVILPDLEIAGYDLLWDSSMEVPPKMPIELAASGSITVAGTSLQLLRLRY